MGWFENLHLEGRGSFRGKGFLVDDVESTIGRKTVVHEFPGKDIPAVEDLGRQSRRFRLTCFVVGNEYHVDRDLLRDEFETAGPGKLIHPHWGEFQVTVVSPVRIRETTAEGGMARFDLDVVEITESDLTIALLDLEPLVGIKADLAAIEVTNDFEGVFSLLGAIESVRTAAVGAITRATSQIRKIRGQANALINLVDDVGSAIDDLEDNIVTLINTPAALARAIQDVHRQVFDGLATVSQVTADLIAGGQKFLEAIDGSSLFDDYRATRALEAFTDLTTNGNDEEPVQDTGSGQSDIEAANQTSIQKVFQTAAAIEAARSFAVFEFDSRDKATEVRDTVAATLDLLAETATDASYGALVDLRAALSAHLSEVAAALPDVIELTPQATVPALAFVYDLYGDLLLENDFLSRNRIENPTQVPGLIPLKVVSSG